MSLPAVGAAIAGAMGGGVEGASAAGGAIASAETVMATATTAAELAPATAGALNAATTLEQGLAAGTNVEDLIETLGDVPLEAVPKVGGEVAVGALGGGGGSSVEAAVTPGKEASVAAGDTLTSSSQVTEGFGVGASKATAETITADKDAIDLSVRQDLDTWDQANQPPNKNTHPTEYNKWCQERSEARKQFAVDAKVNSELSKWDKNNPEPKKGTKDYDDWVDKRVAEESRLREKHTNETGDVPAGEKDKRKDREQLSAAEIKAKIEELKYWKTRSINLGEMISALGTKPTMTENDKKLLKNCSADKSVADAQVRLIASELQFYTKAAPVWQKAAIYAALATVGTGLFIGAAAKPAA